MNNILKFHKYHVWSFEQLFEHLKTLPNEVIYKEYDFEVRSIFDLLLHIFESDYFWYSVLSKGMLDEDISEKESINKIEQLEAAFTKLHKSFYNSLLKQLDYDEIIEFTSPSGNLLNNTVNEIVINTVNHGTYHRGNIAILLRTQGFRSVSIDYSLYARRIRESDR